MITNDNSGTSSSGSTRTSFSGFVDNDGGSSDGVSRSVDDDGSGGMSMSRLARSLGLDAVLVGFDGEAGADSVVALVVNTEEGIVGLGEVGGDIEIDGKIIVDL